MTANQSASANLLFKAWSAGTANLAPHVLEMTQAALTILCEG